MADEGFNDVGIDYPSYGQSYDDDPNFDRDYAYARTK